MAAGFSALGFHAPELEALRRDRLLDGLAREFMRRRLARIERSGQPPGTIFGRELAAGLVAGEGVQIVLGLRCEHEEAHGIGFPLSMVATPI